jgi:hypothetical protein
MRGPLHVDAAAAAVVTAHTRAGAGGLGSTAQKKADGRLSGAMSVWEALTGREGDDALHHAYDVLQVRVLRDEEDAAEDAALAADPAPLHSDYPHEPGTLYDCPACEAVMAAEAAAAAEPPC